MGVKRLFPLALVLAGACTTTGGEGGFHERSEAPRVEKGFFQGDPLDSGEGVFAYSDPMDSGHYGNIFRMSNGRVLAITLAAKSKRGIYAGDVLDVSDVTDKGQVLGVNLPLDGSDTNADIERDAAHVFRFRATFVPKGDDVLISVTDINGSAAKVSLKALLRWRIPKANMPATLGDKKFRVMGQNYGARSGIAFFPEEASLAILDPVAAAAKFHPTYVIELRDGQGKHLASEYPLGESGYVVYWRTDNVWGVRLAK